MIKIFKPALRRAANEDGNVTIEFAIVFPALLLLLISAIEMGVITVRQTLLERGLDIAMREVRIGTGGGYTHDNIRDLICDGAVIFKDCRDNLRLEMIPNSPRHYTALPDTVDCARHDIGTTTVNNDVRAWSMGLPNELVLVRACMLYDPVFPTSQLALSRVKDGNGKSALVAVSAFTQEPR